MGKRTAELLAMNAGAAASVGMPMPTPLPSSPVPPKKLPVPPKKLRPFRTSPSDQVHSQECKHVSLPQNANDAATIVQKGTVTPATITYEDNKTVIVREDAVCHSHSDGVHSHASNDGATHVFTKRKYGFFVRKGEDLRNGAFLIRRERRNQRPDME